MQGRLIRQLSDVGDANETEVLRELEQILSDSVGGAMTVKAARDTFTKVLGRVRGGDMQLIGRKTEDMAVVMSLKDLATIIRSSSKNLSFGSALDEVGFKQLGRRIVVGPRKDRRPLRRHKEDHGSEVRLGM